MERNIGESNWLLSSKLTVHPSKFSGYLPASFVIMASKVLTFTRLSGSGRPGHQFISPSFETIKVGTMFTSRSTDARLTVLFLPRISRDKRSDLFRAYGHSPRTWWVKLGVHKDYSISTKDLSNSCWRMIIRTTPTEILQFWWWHRVQEDQRETDRDQS